VHQKQGSGCLRIIDNQKNLPRLFAKPGLASDIPTARLVRHAPVLVFVTNHGHNCGRAKLRSACVAKQCGDRPEENSGRQGLVKHSFNEGQVAHVGPARQSGNADVRIRTLGFVENPSPVRYAVQQYKVKVM
jgi:hypothetical protein